MSLFEMAGIYASTAGEICPPASPRRGDSRGRHAGRVPRAPWSRHGGPRAFFTVGKKKRKKAGQ